KQAHYALNHPKTYDRDLRRIFSGDARHRQSPTAAAFLRRNRAKIMQIVSQWTGEYQLTLDAIFNDMVNRCRRLRLRAVGCERRLRMEFIVLLTAKTVDSLTGRRADSGSRYEAAARSRARSSRAGAAGLARRAQRGRNQRVEDRV